MRVPHLTGTSPAANRTATEQQASAFRVPVRAFKTPASSREPGEQFLQQRLLVWPRKKRRVKGPPEAHCHPAKGYWGSSSVPPPAGAAPGAGPEALALLLLPRGGRAGAHSGDRHRVQDYRGCTGSDVKEQGPKNPWLRLNHGSCRCESWSCRGSSRHTRGLNGWERPLHYTTLFRASQLLDILKNL